MQTETIAGTEIEVIEQRDGQETTPDGYVRRTNNWRAVYGWELDEAGARTGRLVCAAKDNGATSDVADAPAGPDPLSAYLRAWDEDYVSDFEAEGLL